MCLCKYRPRYDHVDYPLSDIEKGHGEARKEKERRKVQQYGQHFNCPRKMKIVDALSKVRPDPSPLVDADCVVAG